MPCNNADYGPSAGLGASDVRDIVRAELRRSHSDDSDTDRLARYLCAILEALKRQGRDQAFIDMCEKTTDGIAAGEMQEWWRQHQAHDLAEGR